MTLRNHLTYANVASTLALSIALGGGAAYAATTLSPNSVRSGHIVDGQVKRVDIRADAVNGAKVAPNSLRGADIFESSLGTVPRAARATNVLRAIVRADATFVASQSRGVVASGSGGDGDGSYEVIFNRVVTGCTFVVGSAEPGTSGGSSRAMVNVTGRSGHADGIYVQTRNDAGALAALPFSVIGVC